ncbi:MAG: Flagellar motility protein MotE, a chaperone for MotC folding [Rhodobacteraceae bacterium HLUCCA24]|nr:MAG: Flagellar motility protein MotE, a chaperone for MotC folding [Rhodobacteraceae bacterium HLUCCA24]
MSARRSFAAGSGRRATRRRSRGTLAVIAALLIGSALVRLGTEAGQALARTPSDPDTPQDARVDADGCAPAPDIARVLETLATREDRIAAREQEIAERMQALSVANREIDRRMAELEAAEAALRETIALAEDAAEQDLARLTEVYESMKPKEAVPLFEAMAPEFAAGFLGRMRPEVAAGILAGMRPESGYAISALLAGRNLGVPTE